MSHNRLGQETSPYLLQHKDNPVHWYAWGDEAFEAARNANKPILLSIGYAACHWCHVMAHESFESDDMAQVMNELFINIKVDREERPDVDSIYQTALQLMGEHGGWPLTMFLTPAGEPFWGGTYFPSTPRYGRPGFDHVLRSVADTFEKSPDRVGENVTAIKDGLKGAMAPKGGGNIDVALLDEAAAMAVRMIDPYYGGTQGAPKFPQPMFFRFLWQTYIRSGSTMFRDAVTITLKNICQGGIYDHLGGGFARYSTDHEWLAPHFEKMLYDNALLMELMSDVWLVTKDPLYAKRVAETVDWLIREMTAGHDDNGRFGIASALDADSEGEEGKFYVWDADEVDAILGADANAFCTVYDVVSGGNWEGKSILNRLGSMDWDDETEAAMAPLRAKLMAVRDGRIRPGRDDKVLADWNGLVVAAVARAGVVFERPDWIVLAQNIFTWVLEHMTADDGRLRHSLCAGELKHPAVLEDYANLARAAAILYEVTGEQDYLRHAENLVDAAHTHYWDAEAGGYWMAAKDTPGLVAQPKPLMDNAVPAGNGTMAEVMARLFLLTGKETYRERTEALFATFAAEKAQDNIHAPTLLIGWELLNLGTQIVVTGERGDETVDAMLRAALTAPNRLSVITYAGPDNTLPEGHPAHGKGMVDGKPAAYVCVGPTCSLPISDTETLAKNLGQAA